MFSRILIISDNLYLSSQIEAILSKRKMPDVVWRFGISPFSDLQSFKAVLNNNVTVYDLKNGADIVKITSESELVISLHCKQIFPSSLFETVKCINVHPGYNPINRGWYPQVFSIIHDLPIGITIHEITADLDHGPIIVREFVNKELSDTSKTLYDKILQKELEVFEIYLPSIVKREYTAILPEEKGNLFLKKDFYELQELKPEETMTSMQFINRIRALTHGEFKNAYIIDPQDGKKIFLSINLIKEI